MEKSKKKQKTEERTGKPRKRLQNTTKNNLKDFWKNKRRMGESQDTGSKRNKRKKHVDDHTRSTRKKKE